jgi:BTB/POZ domain
MSRAFELMEPQESELSIEDAFARALKDDAFHDVTLQGSDGVQVPANRTILALRSPVFRKMLFGNFQEATKDIVDVDFPGPVVKAVVEYIHTDDAKLLVKLDETKSKGKKIQDDCQVEFQMLLALTAAAAYYGLPKLCHVVQKCLSIYLNAFPFLAFALLEACSQEGPAIAAELKKKALLEIQKLLADKDLDAKILKSLSLYAIKFILIEGKPFLCDQNRFLLVDLWHQAGSTDQDRCSGAKMLVNENVDLEFIDPEDLSTSVTSSGLVTLEQLVDAYKSQALHAKKKFKVSFTKTPISFICPNPTWKASNSTTFVNGTGSWKSDTLECPILRVGRRYTWSVTINGGAQVWLGVVDPTISHTPHLAKSFAGNCVGSYGFLSNYLCEFSNGSQGDSLDTAATVTSGDHVTMIIDLSSADEHMGSLSVSVNSGPAIIITSGMISKLPTGDNQGFVPAASSNGTLVTIDCIEEF